MYADPPQGASASPRLALGALKSERRGSRRERESITSWAVGGFKGPCIFDTGTYCWFTTAALVIYSGYLHKDWFWRYLWRIACGAALVLEGWHSVRGSTRGLLGFGM